MSAKGFYFISTRGFKEGGRGALTSHIAVFERSLYHSGEDREAKERSESANLAGKLSLWPHACQVLFTLFSTLSHLTPKAKPCGLSL